jgi:hypothetical protein
VKLRVWGTPDEVADAVRRLVATFDVVAVSPPYPDRGASVLVRVYLEILLDPTTPAPFAQPPTRRAPRPRGQLP